MYNDLLPIALTELSATNVHQIFAFAAITFTRFNPGRVNSGSDNLTVFRDDSGILQGFVLGSVRDS